MKNLYIIPGCGETEKAQKHQRIMRIAKKLGYNPIVIPVDWEGRKSIRTCVRDTAREISKHGDTKDATILGFSFGACILALFLEKYHFKKVIFCSISPYFKEDMPLWSPKFLKIIQKEFKNDPFATSLMKETFPVIKNQSSVFLVGSKEGEVCIGRSKRSFALCESKKELNVIQDAVHNVGNRHYLKRIEKILE